MRPKTRWWLLKRALLPGRRGEGQFLIMPVYGSEAPLNERTEALIEALAEFMRDETVDRRATWMEGLDAAIEFTARYAAAPDIPLDEGEATTLGDEAARILRRRIVESVRYLSLLRGD